MEFIVAGVEHASLILNLQRVWRPAARCVHPSAARHPRRSLEEVWEVCEGLKHLARLLSFMLRTRREIPRSMRNATKRTKSKD